MDECVLDAFQQVLTQKLYLAGSHVQIRHSPIDRMVFIVRGQMVSHGVGNPILLKEGDVCGEELLEWHLEALSIRKNKGGSPITIFELYIQSCHKMLMFITLLLAYYVCH